MKKYQALEHKADLKIKAFGKDKKSLFENMMLGMQAALRPKLKKKETTTRIEVESEELESLLVDFLAEINYLNEVNRAAYSEVRFYQFGDNKIEAELLGRKVERFGLQIKGVTFHDLSVQQKEDGGWEATVLFDI